MHRLFHGLSYVLIKNVAMQLVRAQAEVVSTYVRHPGHARRGHSGQAPLGGWGPTPGTAGRGRALRRSPSARPSAPLRPPSARPPPSSGPSGPQKRKKMRSLSL